MIVTREKLRALDALATNLSFPMDEFSRRETEIDAQSGPAPRNEGIAQVKPRRRQAPLQDLCRRGEAQPLHLSLCLPMRFEKVGWRQRNRTWPFPFQLVATSDDLRREIAGTEVETRVLS
jgi:hypothetical protein